MNKECPMPQDSRERISMAHGAGARLTNALIEDVFRQAFDNPALNEAHDAALLETPKGERLAMSTDSFVISPLFFSGGDIGKLSICGTVNDLLMGGAKPRWLSAGFILEEGFPINDLKQVVQSMQATCLEAGVQLVTGDTKVVEKGKGDGLFINTCGVGFVPEGVVCGPRSIRSGDVIIVSGDVGRHGVSILAKRSGLSFETDLLSDCALLKNPVGALYEAGIEVHCMRDLTRGGLGAALVELNDASGFGIRVEELQIPVCGEVKGACEMLGIDPIFVPCEGRFVCIIPEADSDRALAVLKGFDPAAATIGRVEARAEIGRATIRSCLGVDRIIDLPSGEPLPRIC